MKNTNDLSRSSSFIFEGTVVGIGESTLEETNNPLFFTVRVNKIIKGNEFTKSLVTQIATLNPVENFVLLKGDKAIFFTDGWKFGKGIGLICHGIENIDEQAIGLISEDELYKTELKEKLIESQICICGRVQSIESVNFGEDSISEHNPFWNQAEIEVIEIIKGNANNTIKLIFPNSIDVLWYDKPKFHQNQEGIWFLHEGIKDYANIFPSKTLKYISSIKEGYTALGKFDFITISNLNLVKQLKSTLK